VKHENHLLTDAEVRSGLVFMDVHRRTGGGAGAISAACRSAGNIDLALFRSWVLKG